MAQRLLRSVESSKVLSQTSPSVMNPMTSRRPGERRIENRRRGDGPRSAQCRRLRKSRLTRPRNWRKDHLPWRPFMRLTACRATRQPFRPAYRRQRQIEPAETIALNRGAQRQRREAGFRPLPMNAERMFSPKISRSSLERSPWRRSRRRATTVRLQIESEPSWVGTSSAMNPNLANAGSGGCARDGDTRQNTSADSAVRASLILVDDPQLYVASDFEACAPARRTSDGQRS